MLIFLGVNWDWQAWENLDLCIRGRWGWSTLVDVVAICVFCCFRCNWISFSLVCQITVCHTCRIIAENQWNFWTGCFVSIYVSTLHVKSLAWLCYGHFSWPASWNFSTGFEYWNWKTRMGPGQFCCGCQWKGTTNLMSGLHILCCYSLLGQHHFGYVLALLWNSFISVLKFIRLSDPYPFVCIYDLVTVTEYQHFSVNNQIMF